MSSADLDHQTHGPGLSHRLSHILDHVAHYLPSQGPIGVFIHHNTLHAFQHLPFEQAVLTASDLYGAEPYMQEEAFHNEVERGRIRAEDIEDILASEANAAILPGRLDRRTLRRVMLMPGVRRITPTTVHWHLEEGDLFEHYRRTLPSRTQPDSELHSLWSECIRRSEKPVDTETPIPERPRDGILAATGVDLDDIVHPALIRLTAAFLDQGMAYWTMPDRDEGFFKAVCRLFAQPAMIEPEHLQGLSDVARDRIQSNASPASTVLETLRFFGVEDNEWEPFLQSELLALRGWAGLMRMLESEPELAPHERVPCTLLDFLAVRLMLTTVAASNIADKRARGESIASIWRQRPGDTTDRQAEALVYAVRLFDVAQLTGITADELQHLPPDQFQLLQHEIEAFNERERRRVFQLAYERRHELDILLPLAEHRRNLKLTLPVRVTAQVMFCLDEREESIRRHLEEIDPSVETLAAAGFYGVAVNYTGLDDAHGAALCPVVVKPQHAVTEQPRHTDVDLHRRRQERRRLWAAGARHLFISSRTLARGWFSTAVLGVFSLFPLIARVLTPRQFANFCERLNRSFLPEPRTELTFMRADAESRDATRGLLLGFSVQEKIDRVAGVLGPAGLYRTFARIVVVLGHGSTSLNNPHESAHDCGACGGRRGGPNARLFAAMANRPEVRNGLALQGIHIPDDTWFVGGYHDTCSDEIEYFDIDVIPTSHASDFARIQQLLDRARALSAHERARRFEAADATLSPTAALHHAEERSEHLAEPRPEYGHCTNALCFVGRRSVTRGLFFDRRAFLTSYDATLDPDDESLARLLGAVIPVCAGISLEYYFSFVDNETYGCGTKLPHNVTGLVGVMNGHASDLRTGLPWQMVEIHEPVRCLFVVESTPERILRTINKNPLLSEFLHNRWIRLASIDPQSGAIHRFQNGAFEPFEPGPFQLPTAPSSVAWYSGKRQHLPVARIQSEATLHT